MTVSVREVGGLDCIGPGLQWLNGWIGWCYSQDLYTKQQCSTRRIAPHQGSSSNTSLEKETFRDFMKTQKHLNDYFLRTEQPPSWRLCLISSGLDDLWSVHDWMTLSSPLHVTFPLPGGSSHFNLTLNWLFIHSVQVSKSLGITFQLETFKDQYSNSWMIALVIKIQGVQFKMYWRIGFI